MIMRIVHISDFHLDFSSIEDLRNYIIKPLKEDLLEFHNNREIDLILFSGDMVDKGELVSMETLCLLLYFPRRGN